MKSGAQRVSSRSLGDCEPSDDVASPEHSIFSSLRLAFYLPALLLIPGFDQLRFNPLLCRCKKRWNASEAKYSPFWSAGTFSAKVGKVKVRLGECGGYPRPVKVVLAFVCLTP